MVAASGTRHPASGEDTSERMVVSKIESYRDLEVWQRAFELSLAVYDATQQMPADERFGLTSQIRRSAVSVPSNIAEGFGRGSRVDYTRFLKIARGSLYELETQLLIASSRRWLDTEIQLSPLCKSTGQMLAALITKLEQ
jgi:four helix bundle protein